MYAVNVYDFTNTGNYLENHEYLCFLEQPHVREALHLGDAQFQNGHLAHKKMQAAIMKEGMESGMFGLQLLSV